mmetsp:Transcript_12784/g.18332  ORF Transcript_12784/g.18332 Transcript_12784/m.18332 type:complete len:80 (+) Transcript_12784:1308-1547(+)
MSHPISKQYELARRRCRKYPTSTSSHATLHGSHGLGMEKGKPESREKDEKQIRDVFSSLQSCPALHDCRALKSSTSPRA